MIKLTRMNATGNTFFICDQTDGKNKIKNKIKFVKQVCQKTSGLSADGVVFLQKDKSPYFKWDFYNSDGSKAEMCGNAARCVGLYFFKKTKKKDIVFSTDQFEVSVKIIKTKPSAVIRVKMPEVKNTKKTMWIAKKKGYFINVGVPHFVIQLSPELLLAKRIRKAKSLGWAGTNVTFIRVRSQTQATAVTYERGVENYTLSCGTGAVAAAQVLKEFWPKHRWQIIQMPGGTLRVDWKNKTPYLTGAAQIDFEISLDWKTK